MTVAIRYQTRNGNTQAFAEQIASVAGVPAQSIDTPVEQADTLFFGGGTYFMKPDKTASAFMKNLDPTKIKQITLFTTSGGPEMVSDKALTKIATEKGIPVIGHFHQVMGGKGMKIIGSTGGKLKDEQIELVKEFAQKMLAQ
ncbi:flavoprotein [Lactiplantibacillus plantarum]|uniref:flavoprotein n=1 Tax=Lactiplantibacillus plantarum TaxID=1590 RepID=UPI0008637707|nr:flavoprotein [Lactiplantibacillus plantarum]OEZ34574.1 flavoprotein [Lactiplantibacillus plantarum]QGX67729.1 flavoprotein [Lactiplantibacillus plantarum]WBB04059.1 flavoprotein [Lactiplantibacillus plantarum]